MPFDAMFLSAVCDELRQELIGARVEKIQQPARDMVVLQLRGIFPVFRPRIARLRRHGQCGQRHDIGLFLECLQYIFGIFCCADDDGQRQDLLGVDDQRSAVL